MKILVTAFDPFGGETVNPAYEAVKLLPDVIDGAEIIKAEVPTVFARAVGVVTDEIERIRPDAVLCIGQAGGRYAITPERVAVNIDDSAIADNEGAQPVDLPIAPEGAPAYFSGLPIKAMVKKIREAGIPAEISNSAGTFVCNHLMYGVCRLIDEKYPSMRGGFMHVPFIPSQTVTRTAPSMSTETIASGIAAAISAIIEN